MVLKIYNQKPKSNLTTGLYLSPLAEVKTCAAAIGGGSIMARIAFAAFELAATPIIFASAGAAIAFLSAVDVIHDKMAKRAMQNGDVVIRHHRRPFIEP